MLPPARDERSHAMRKRIVWSVVPLGIVGTGLGAYALAGSGQVGRPDCPGTVV